MAMWRGSAAGGVVLLQRVRSAGPVDMTEWPAYAVGDGAHVLGEFAGIVLEVGFADQRFAVVPIGRTLSLLGENLKGCEFLSLLAHGVVRPADLVAGDLFGINVALQLADATNHVSRVDDVL